MHNLDKNRESVPNRITFRVMKTNFRSMIV